MNLNDPLSPSLNETSAPPRTCCVRLRCKSMYYRPDERPGKLHTSDTHKVVPPLHGALLKTEQDVHLFEKLVFMSRRKTT